MKLELFLFTCVPHGHRFEAPNLPSGGYGTFLLRSLNGELAVLFAIDSTEYAEVAEMIRRECPNLDDLEGARTLRRVFGVACDPAPDGSPFSIEGKPPCPICGVTPMTDWESIDPPRYVEMLVPPVTHHHWHLLTTSERMATVREAISNR